MKICTKCGEAKNISEFYKERRGKFGVRGDCKKCNNAKSRKYHIEHAEKRRNEVRQWRENNPELVRAQKLRHSKRQSKHIVNRVRKWRQENPEKRRVQALIDSQNRRAKIRKSPGNGITQDDIDWILKRDLYRCLNCGSDNDLTVDHVIPIDKGGAHDRSNIQTLCNLCNTKKATKIIDYRLVAYA